MTIIVPLSNVTFALPIPGHTDFKYTDVLGLVVIMTGEISRYDVVMGCSVTFFSWQFAMIFDAKARKEIFFLLWGLHRIVIEKTKNNQK
jgi:hypothetical protein